MATVLLLLLSPPLLLHLHSHQSSPVAPTMFIFRALRSIVQDNAPQHPLSSFFSASPRYVIKNNSRCGIEYKSHLPGAYLYIFRGAFVPVPTLYALAPNNFDWTWLRTSIMPRQSHNRERFCWPIDVAICRAIPDLWVRKRKLHFEKILSDIDALVPILFQFHIPIGRICKKRWLSRLYRFEQALRTIIKLK